MVISRFGKVLETSIMKMYLNSKNMNTIYLNKTKCYILIKDSSTNTFLHVH